MNYIKHLTGFFEKASHDLNLNPTHISLYVAIFQLWNKSSFKKAIPISREELMRISKIGSNTTYHKCIKELHERNYVRYMPSFNQFKGSTVEVIPLENYKHPEKVFKTLKSCSPFKLHTEQETERVLNNPCTSTKLLPYINHLNLTNFENGITSQKEDCSDSLLLENGLEAPKKLRLKKGSSDCDPFPPLWASVHSFFIANDYPEVEAQKFYNYYESIGWFIGGKSPMRDWKAAARNWILNTAHYQAKNNSPKAHHLHTPNTKNYDEPL